MSTDEMVKSLAKLVVYKTISSNRKFSVECNQGAAFLRRHCNYLGAKTRLLSSGQDTNPIVHAKFDATCADKVDKTLLFYGHYDVVGADTNRQKWKTDPFQLTSINGFLYGRGVSDNKGPILAALYAAADLSRAKELRCNIVFLIEGEEESGSQMFRETVQKNKMQIGKVDWILLANSYYLDDFHPCLTYGLRGVVHANLVITSDHPDLHSGIDGSSLLDEPLKDLVLLLATLVGPMGKINIPGFEDPVLPLTEAEKQRYAVIAETILPLHPEIRDREAFIDSLMHRWREPSLTIHSVDVPGCQNATTTISHKAKASLSIRIVPNQDADEVAANLTAYVQDQFTLLESQNHLMVEITGKSEPWLGDPENEIFETLADAISAAWTPSADEMTTHRHMYSRIDNAIQTQTPTISHTTPAIPPTPNHQVHDAENGNLPLPRDSSDGGATNGAGRGITSAPARKTTMRKRSTTSAPVPTSSTLINKHNSAANADGAATGTLTSAATGYVKDTRRAASPLPRSLRRQHDGTDDGDRMRQQLSHGRVEPIYIREGGSIPTIRYLEKEFGAPAANLPCGQASDNAHLDNERLRIENLYKSREIFRYVFAKLPERSVHSGYHKNMGYGS